MFLRKYVSLQKILIMRLFYIFILFSFFSFSQTNEVVINQAVQQAEAQNIETKSQAVNALEASGMTETQARQLAAQRGISYVKHE